LLATVFTPVRNQYPPKIVNRRIDAGGKMGMAERGPTGEQIAEFASKHGIPERISQLILKINSPSAKRCDAAAVSYLNAEAQRFARRNSRSPEVNNPLDQNRR
jgi:hypothetical protein